MSIKIDSPLTVKDAGTSQGLIVAADDKNYLIFCVSTNGTTISLSAHTITQGASQALFEHQGLEENQEALYLRLLRNGADYTAYYSVDGNVWTEAGSFSDGIQPTAVGPFAANYSANPARAVPVIMAVNWFHVL